MNEFNTDRKIGNAIKTLDSDAKGKVLLLKNKVRDIFVAVILTEKQAEGQPLNPSCLVSHEKANPMPFHNSILID